MGCYYSHDPLNEAYLSIIEKVQNPEIAPVQTSSSTKGLINNLMRIHSMDLATAIAEIYVDLCYVAADNNIRLDEVVDAHYFPLNRTTMQKEQAAE